MSDNGADHVLLVVDSGHEAAGAASLAVADLQIEVGINEIAGAATGTFVIYGRPGETAGGYANVHVPGGIMYGSSDPANELGGIVGFVLIGCDVHLPADFPVDPGVNDPDDAVTGTARSDSWTVRCFPGTQPGMLVGAARLIQNLFDGSGSRAHNAAYVALTRPGIGDGPDFFTGGDFRESETFPVDYGFIAAGSSGTLIAPDGDVGFRVAFQAGGRAETWSGDYDPTDPTDSDGYSKIGTGLLARDWTSRAIKILPPHDDAADELAVELVDGNDDPLFTVAADGQVNSAKEGWHYVGGGGGEPAFGSGWSNVPTQTKMSFRLIDGFVHIMGFVWRGGGDLDNTEVCQLPVGYRPSANVNMAVILFDGSFLERAGRMLVTPDGSVQFNTADFTGIIAGEACAGARFPLIAPDVAA